MVPTMMVHRLPLESDMKSPRIDVVEQGISSLVNEVHLETLYGNSDWQHDLDEVNLPRSNHRGTAKGTRRKLTLTHRS